MEQEQQDWSRLQLGRKQGLPDVRTIVSEYCVLFLLLAGPRRGAELCTGPRTPDVKLAVARNTNCYYVLMGSLDLDRYTHRPLDAPRLLGVPLLACLGEGTKCLGTQVGNVY